MTEWWWAYIAVGAVVGFLSGMFGIGGGSLTVPVLAFIFVTKGVGADHAFHLALGTGVATILFTSLSSVRSHHARGAVNWRVFRAIAPGIVIGTFSGALLAGYLDARVLSLLFALLMYYAAALMLWPSAPRSGAAHLKTGTASLFGVVVGVFSSLTAIGGASLVVPFLTKRGVTVHEGIGTAAAVGWPLAAAGSAGYVAGGWNVPLPAYSVGFVYLPALAGIVVASVLTAPLGAAVAHRTPAPRLRKVFAVVLVALATGVLFKFL